MSKIIAFYGQQQSGKSTAADAVSAWQGWLKVSFAQPLYNMVSALLGTDARFLDKEAPQESLQGKSLRYTLQTLGTNWGRKMIGEEIWLHQMGRYFGKPFNVVIDDLRFRNEYDFLRQHGAVIVRIDRPDAEAPDQTHDSEKDWSAFEPDYTLVNDRPSSSDWQMEVRQKLRHLL